MIAGRCVASITCAIVKVLPEPVTPSSTCERSWRLTPSTSSAIARGWSPSGLKSDVIQKRWPPSVLSGRGGPRRPVRRPPPRHALLVEKFAPALAQQPVERIGGGGDAHLAERDTRRPR